MTRAGLGEASRRRRSASPSTRRAALAKLPLLRKSDLPALQKETPPFGGFNVTPPGKAKRLLHVAGADLRAGGPRRATGGAARALFAAGFRARRHRAQLVLLSSDARRLDSRSRRACARLRRHPRRRRQHRAAARRDRASQADRLCRHAGLSENPARYRGEAGKDASSIKRGLVSGAALPASLRAGARGARHRGAAMLCHRRDRRHRLRERRARGHDRQRRHDRRDRAARHRRSGRRRRGRRGRRHHRSIPTIR